MLTTLITATTAITLLVIGWAVVQKLWGNTFSDYLEDEDVLAGRTKCGNCGCTTACANKIDQKP